MERASQHPPEPRKRAVLMVAKVTPDYPSQWAANNAVAQRMSIGTAETLRKLAITTATELMTYCRTLGVPFGINVESVSIRRVEIEASVRLAQQLRTQIRS